jgi:CheY-specific phosphatase CheX
MTDAVLQGQFAPMSIRRETPRIVHDRIIFGEVFSLIPLESSWCRGYMMLQTEEEPLLDVLGREGAAGNPGNVRMVNDRLGEIANMIWGAFKNKYIGDGRGAGLSQVQVPLVVNHRHKYISFGTENPHLCFIYQMSDPSTGRTLKFYERFVFNLSWAPQDFREVDDVVEGLVDSGEIELL